MAKISAIEKEETRKRILEVSREVFREMGYNETQLKYIAQKVGIGVSTLYGYFPSKSELFVSTFIEILLKDDFDPEKVTVRLEDGISEAIFEIFVSPKLKEIGTDRQLIKNFFIHSFADERNQINQKKESMSCKKLEEIKTVLEMYERTNLRLCAFSLNHLAEAISILLDHFGKEYMLSDDMTLEALKIEMMNQLNVLFAGKYKIVPYE